MAVFNASNLQQVFPDTLGGIGDRTLAPLIDAAFDEFVEKGQYSKRPELWTEDTVFGYFSPLQIRASEQDLPVLTDFVRENYEAIRDRAMESVRETVRGFHGNEFVRSDVLRIYEIHPLWAKEHGGEGTEEFYKCMGAERL